MRGITLPRKNYRGLEPEISSLERSGDLTTQSQTVGVNKLGEKYMRHLSQSKGITEKAQYAGYSTDHDGTAQKYRKSYQSSLLLSQ
jgi:hypothetical protein